MPNYSCSGSSNRHDRYDTIIPSSSKRHDKQSTNYQNAYNTSQNASYSESYTSSLSHYKQSNVSLFCLFFYFLF